jgi:Flp pilus assembly pilin Flp
MQELRCTLRVNNSAKDFGNLPLRSKFVLIEWRGSTSQGGTFVASFLKQLWSDERGQDIAEYAVMLAVILVIVVGTVRLIGTNANSVFSQVSSSIGS